MQVNSLFIEEIKQIIEKNCLPSYRAKQIFNWLHKQQIQDFSKMNNISKSDREKLNTTFEITALEIAKVLRSSDGSKKYLFELSDKNQIEAVIMKGAKQRKTACVSSQVGCPLKCGICATGKIGFKRDLTAAEIIAQIELLYKESNGFENVVFMGMGEPLLNLDNVLKSIEIINHKDGLNIGARKITISTAGLPHQIIKLTEFQKQIRLAVSLNSAIEKKRNEIMPINNKYPLKRLIPAIRKYNEATGRRVTFEYVLIKDFNDQEEDLIALMEACQDLIVNVNLIPLNPCGQKMKPSSEKVQNWFLEQLLRNKVNAVLRKSKGADIMAACGQLAV
ncbi:23S rRNA (adenine(2503)-C(2))-methyltransferase RlmN [Candidatus Margulisiibacteriota bacterium]